MAMQTLWKHLGIAAIALAAATAARWSLHPWVEFRVPHVTYFVAIVFIAWRTTTPVAIGSLVASWLIATFYFVPPRFEFALETAGDWIGSTAYFVVTLSIVLIAERMRHAQRQSVWSESRLDLIGNRLPALVSYVGTDGRYVWCNEEYTRWFGLTREQVIGRTLEEVLGTEAWSRVRPHVEAALAGRTVEYETEARYAHGGTRWIHVTYTPHKSADGRIRGVVAMVRDISDRKHAEQGSALLADLHQAFALTPSAADAVRQVTTRLVEQLDLTRCLLGEIDEVGDSVRVLHQHSAMPEATPAGEYRVSDYLTEEERGRLAAGKPLVIDDVNAGRGAEAAARFRTLGIGAVVSAPYVAEGRRKFALAAEKGAPYRWRDDEVALLKEVADRLFVQLDRARAQQAVRENERRYRLLAQVLTNLPVSVDRSGRFVASQDAWARYTGQSFEKSRDFGWFDAVHPDDREAARLAWVESLRTRRPYEVRVRIWHAASACFRHVIARATPLVDESGELLEWVGACTDIHEEIEQSLALVEADRRKDEFLATLAHELRNPLAPIRNGLYILKATGNAEGALGNVHLILERQIRHLVRLVDDLLDVSRITRGRIDLRREVTDVQAILDASLETSRPAIDGAGHALSVSIPPEPLRLEADPVRLAQVLTNLLNNAAKFTAPGGKIYVTARREGPDAVISVLDNGRGIAPEILPRLFNLFTQAEPGMAQPQDGLGIGLGLAKRLVELHGGKIEAHSKGPGHGSEFVVRLPTVSTPAGGASVAGPGPEREQPRRVLIVDDNRDAADSLGVVLALHGCETRTVYDGLAALEALDESAPDVVLLDLGLPGLNGHEIAQRMRQHPRGRRVTIVALTGWGQERDRQRSREAGIDHHLVKPIDIEVLRRLLASLPAGNRAA
jgi:PAS domain S-box-containing protein